jgi:hypothetical protein
MKTILRLGYALALVALATPAGATGGDSTSVTTILAQSCAFTSPGFTATISPVIGVYDVGSLSFSCNFVGTASVNLNVPGGTNLKNGTNKAHYRIAWDIPPNGLEYHQSTISATAFSETFDADTAAAPNGTVTGHIWVDLTQTPAVAGSYISVATFTLSP